MHFRKLNHFLIEKNIGEVWITMELVGGGWVVQSKFSVQLRPKLSNKQTRAIAKLFLRVTLTLKNNFTTALLIYEIFESCIIYHISDHHYPSFNIV